jgi:hypothetical protein
LFTDLTTWQQFFAVNLITHGCVEGTQEKFEHGRAIYLNQGPELMHFQRRFFLVFVEKAIRRECSIVAEVLA